MAKKKRGEAHGGHGWFVTFADLMALLMAFFVMVAAYSTMDKQKMTMLVGSMREAFGTQTQFRAAGLVELDGIPGAPHIRHMERATPDEASDRPGPREGNVRVTDAMRAAAERRMATAAASLRQAMQDMPEIAEVSRQIIFQETEQGLDIQIVDQDGRAMFPDGSAEPFERTRRILARLAESLRALPNRIAITGHTSASRLPPRPDYGPWDLSADRAVRVRAILSEYGVPSNRFHSVTGRADTEPLFPDDPYLAANRRVSILLMREVSALPANMRP